MYSDSSDARISLLESDGFAMTDRRTEILGRDRWMDAVFGRTRSTVGRDQWMDTIIGRTRSTVKCYQWMDAVFGRTQSMDGRD